MYKCALYKLAGGGLYYGELSEIGLPDGDWGNTIWEDDKRYCGQWKRGR